MDKEQYSKLSKAELIDKLMQLEKETKRHFIEGEEVYVAHIKVLKNAGQAIYRNNYPIYCTTVDARVLHGKIKNYNSSTAKKEAIYDVVIEHRDTEFPTTSCTLIAVPESHIFTDEAVALAKAEELKQEEDDNALSMGFQDYSKYIFTDNRVPERGETTLEENAYIAVAKWQFEALKREYGEEYKSLESHMSTLCSSYARLGTTKGDASEKHKMRLNILSTAYVVYDNLVNVERIRTMLNTLVERFGKQLICPNPDKMWGIPTILASEIKTYQKRKYYDSYKETYNSIMQNFIL